MDFFLDFVEVGDWAWEHVSKWRPLAVDTIGKQLVRAIDRVGATLVEGDGRYSDAEAAHFFTIARGSARETRFWIQRAVKRQLLSENEATQQLAKLASATRRLNTVINFRRSAVKGKVQKESRIPYSADSLEVYYADDDLIAVTPNAQRPSPNAHE